MRHHLQSAVIALAILTLTAACGLTPDQLRAIGDSKAATTVCFHAKTMGVESTTVVTNAGDGRGRVNNLEVLTDCATSSTQGFLPTPRVPQ